MNFQNTRWEISRRRREDTDLLHYTVYMPEMPATGVPALDLVFRIRITDRDGRSRLGWDWYRDYTATIQRRGKRQLDYEAWSEVSEQDTAAMRQVSGDAAALWAERGLAFDYETYTRHDLLESTQDKIRELTGGKDSTYDKATAIERWLIGSDFEYTLELPPLPKSHPIDAFMTEVRAGHCERFATAMALSMRSLGVPSRVVSGYLGAELNESDDSYIVRKSMAHLWVEVWIPDFGWVRFDPSPSGDAIRLSPFQRMTLMFSRQRLKAQMLWYREVVGFSGAFQLERLKEFTLGVVRGFSIPGETSVGEALDADSRIELPFGVILTAGAAVLFILLVRRARRAKKKPKWKLTEDQRRSVGLYHTLKQRLRRCGLPSTGDTAGALLDALDASGRAPLGIVRPMIEVYNEVRFGHRPLTRERYAELVQQIKHLQPATE